MEESRGSSPFLVWGAVLVLIMLYLALKPSTPRMTIDPLPEGAHENTQYQNSHNKLASDNKANVVLFGYQHVEDNSCTAYAAGGCVTNIITTTTTTVDNSHTTYTFDVNGNMVFSDGTVSCRDPNGGAGYSPSYCGAQP